MEAEFESRSLCGGPSGPLRSAVQMSTPRADPRVHARFLSYRERHVYFGRGESRQPLSLERFSELDAEHEVLARIAKRSRSAEQVARLAELATMLHYD